MSQSADCLLFELLISFEGRSRKITFNVYPMTSVQISGERGCGNGVISPLSPGSQWFVAKDTWIKIGLWLNNDCEYLAMLGMILPHGGDVGNDSASWGRCWEWFCPMGAVLGMNPPDGGSVGNESTRWGHYLEKIRMMGALLGMVPPDGGSVWEWFRLMRCTSQAVSHC